MTNKRLIARVAPIVITLVALAGCSGGAKIPKTFPVKGHVTYHGQPVEGATVNLVPTILEGRGGAAITDAQGKFVIKTYFGPQHEPKGALPGDYQVMITKFAPRESGNSVNMSLAPAPIQGVPSGVPYIPPRKSLIPTKYKDPKTSGLEVKVTDKTPEQKYELTD